MPTACIKMDSNNVCTDCEWGHVLTEGNCIARDGNCHTFESPGSVLCLNCYSGYTVFPQDHSKCVLSNLIFEQCLKYNAQMECQQCQAGYVLAANMAAQPAFICNLIDPNCLQFNASSKMC